MLVDMLWATHPSQTILRDAAATGRQSGAVLVGRSDEEGGCSQSDFSPCSHSGDPRFKEATGKN